jgi:hypothetical protein
MIALLYYGGRGYFNAKSSVQTEPSPSNGFPVEKTVTAGYRLENTSPVVSPSPGTAKQHQSSVPQTQKTSTEESIRPVAVLLDDLKTTRDEATSHQITLELLNLLESDQIHSRQEAFQLLLTMKDFVHGENLQEVFKRMQQFGEEGGNDALVDSFVNRKELEGQNRSRLLSYLDPGVPLGAQAVGQLTMVYQENQEQGARQGIVHALARAGDEDGAAWIIDRAKQAVEFSEWEMMINSLAFSTSPAAFDYLHTTLNTLVPESPMYKEHMEILRQAIKNTQQQQESRQ